MEFLPISRPEIDAATIAAVADVLRSGWITTGQRALAFEAALSEYFGGRPVRVACSGSITLEIALRLAGVGPGDEVITTPVSWAATANVVLTIGARPVFVDVDPATRNIDVARIEGAISTRTRAIIPVDLCGLPVDRDRLYEIAKQHKLRVIEDAAQAMGASWHGRRIGSFGDLVSFSFHANKNMTTAEGGCLVLNTPEQARQFEKLRLHGVTRYGDGDMDVDVLGCKANLTDIAAAIGILQLRRLPEFTARRRDLARFYFRHIDRSLGLDLPREDFDDCNWHMFQPLLPLKRLTISRGEFIAAMKVRGIGVGVHYPAIHLFSLYRSLGWREGQFPEAERIGRSTVTLPLFPAMTEGDVVRVCVAVADVIRTAMRSGIAGRQASRRTRSWRPDRIGTGRQTDD